VVATRMQVDDKCVSTNFSTNCISARVYVSMYIVCIPLVNVYIIHEYMYRCVYVCICVNIHICMHIYIHVCMYVYIHMYIRIWMHVYMRICI